VLRRWLCLWLVAAGMAAGCGGGGDRAQPDDGGRGAITVGSKEDTEAQLLGRLLALTLADKGYQVTAKIPLGSTDLVRAALTSGRIDVYWEFTSSGLSVLHEDPVGDPTAAYEKVKALDAKNGITWLPPAAMNDTYALAVKGDGPISATTLSDLARLLTTKPRMRLCADPEGSFRKDVLPRLHDGYGMDFAEVRQLDNALIPPAVAGGQCDVGIVYSTAALIVKNGLRVLTDDKRALGAYTPAPILRTDRLGRWPNLTADVAPLTAALDTPTITQLNARVDVDRRTVEDVANQFLVERGLIGGGERPRTTH
jgi:osmoprotectant transport system substrate-binding protein